MKDSEYYAEKAVEQMLHLMYLDSHDNEEVSPTPRMLKAARVFVRAVAEEKLEVLLRREGVIKRLSHEDRRAMLAGETP